VIERADRHPANLDLRPRGDGRGEQERDAGGNPLCILTVTHHEFPY
jgi:hypothetical protein